jgi:hypothetical protein
MTSMELKGIFVEGKKLMTAYVFNSVETIAEY